MSVVLRGGRIIDSQGERLLDVELGEDGRIANPDALEAHQGRASLPVESGCLEQSHYRLQ